MKQVTGKNKHKILTSDGAVNIDSHEEMVIKHLCNRQKGSNHRKSKKVGRIC